MSKRLLNIAENLLADYSMEGYSFEELKGEGQDKVLIYNKSGYLVADISEDLTVTRYTINLIDKDVVRDIESRFRKFGYTKDDYFISLGISSLINPYEGDGLYNNELKSFDGFSDEEKEVVTVLFDMDGVLARFCKEGYFDSDTLTHYCYMPDEDNSEYFKYLPVCSEAVQLYNDLKQKSIESQETDHPFNVKIASKASADTIDSKIEWARKIIPDIKFSDFIFIPLTADKADFVPNINKSILIDDHTPNLLSFREKGGIAMHFASMSSRYHEGDLRTAMCEGANAMLYQRVTEQNYLNVYDMILNLQNKDIEETLKSDLTNVKYSNNKEK